MEILKLFLVFRLHIRIRVGPRTPSISRSGVLPVEQLIKHLYLMSWKLLKTILMKSSMKTASTLQLLPIRTISKLRVLDNVLSIFIERKVFFLFGMAILQIVYVTCRLQNNVVLTSSRHPKSIVLILRYCKNLVT